MDFIGDFISECCAKKKEHLSVHLSFTETFMIGLKDKAMTTRSVKLLSEPACVIEVS